MLNKKILAVVRRLCPRIILLFLTNVSDNHKRYIILFVLTAVITTTLSLSSYLLTNSLSLPITILQTLIGFIISLIVYIFGNRKINNLNNIILSSNKTLEEIQIGLARYWDIENEKIFKRLQIILIRTIDLRKKFNFKYNNFMPQNYQTYICKSLIKVDYGPDIERLQMYIQNIYSQDLMEDLFILKENLDKIGRDNHYCISLYETIIENIENFESHLKMEIDVALGKTGYG